MTWEGEINEVLPEISTRLRIREYGLVGAPDAGALMWSELICSVGVVVLPRQSCQFVVFAL